MKLLNRASATIGATSLYLFTAVQVFAQTPGPNEIVPDGTPLINLTNNEATVNTLVRWIIIVLVAIGVIAALIWLIIGAIKWIVSGGDKEKVATARGQIIAAIIGLIIVLLSVVILNFVMGLLGAGNVLDPKIPNLRCYIEDNCGPNDQVLINP